MNSNLNSPLVEISNLPEALKTIGSAAFHGTGIRNLKAAGNLKTLADGWYWNDGMGDFTEYTEYPGTFSNCTLLESVDFSETSLKSIPDNAFSGCTALDEIILPESTVSIGNKVFYDTAIRDISFLPKVSYVGDEAFSNCRRLVAVTMPQTVTMVNERTFAECPRLLSISLPKGTTNVGKEIVNNDKKLANISCAEPDAPAAENGAFDNIRLRYVSLVVPTSSFRAYLNAPQWGKFESIQNKIVVSIDEGVDVSTVEEEEYQDMVEEDQLEEAQENAAVENKEMSPLRRARRAAARAKTARNFASVFDGAQIQTGKYGTGTRIFINPKEGVEITSVKFGGNEMVALMDKDNSILLPPNSQGSLEIKTSLGKSDIKEISSDHHDGHVEVFDLNGFKVASSIDNLPQGIYVVRHGSKVEKVIIK